MAAVPAVAITTDRGRLLLEMGRPIDVREGLKITERLPEALGPGAIVLVGRRQGRVGLLEALEERLGDRPDLLAARLLVEDYRRRVRTRFAASRLSIANLHRALVGRGCDKTNAAVRSWVTGVTMAPQQFEDLEKLNDALDLELAPLQLRELFAGVQRRRGFRRAAGRALAAAARGSTVVADENRVDAETGFSIADLRDAVVEAVVHRGPLLRQTGSPNAPRQIGGPVTAPNTDDAARFVAWMLDSVIADGRGDCMQTLPVAPSGRLWLGRLAPEIVVQNSRLGERK